MFSDDTYGGNHIVKGTVFTRYKQFVENCFALMPRQGLHAKTLGFTHPVSRKRLVFDSELPEDFTAVLNKWRHYLQYHPVENEEEHKPDKQEQKLLNLKK